MVRAWQPVEVGNLSSTSSSAVPGGRPGEDPGEPRETTAMKPHGRGTRNAVKVGLLAAGVLLGLSPMVASAQDCPAGANILQGVLVETIEQTDVRLGDEGKLERYARATERGALAVGCGSLAGLRGRMMVHAESWVEVFDPTVPLLGAGPITGTFHIYPEDGNGSVKGVLTGTLDFAPTRGDTSPWREQCGGPCPFVLVEGGWTTSGKSPIAGWFGGLALVPFPCGPSLCYMDPTKTLGVGPIPLTAEELIPAPSAKFVITLFQ